MKCHLGEVSDASISKSNFYLGRHFVCASQSLRKQIIFDPHGKRLNGNLS